MYYDSNINSRHLSRLIILCIPLHLYTVYLTTCSINKNKENSLVETILNFLLLLINYPSFLLILFLSMWILTTVYRIPFMLLLTFIYSNYFVFILILLSTYLPVAYTSSLVTQALSRYYGFTDKDINYSVSYVTVNITWDKCLIMLSIASIVFFLNVCLFYY